MAIACGVLLGISSEALGAPRSSSDVAIIQGTGSGDVGAMPESGTVDGWPNDSFDQFSFSDLDQSSIDSATLAQYDTVVLNQVFTSELGPSQEQALSDFVTSGGKLIIHDSDGTVADDYAWLPVPARTGVSCQNCGNTDGVATIVESNAMVSGDPSSPAYIDVSELPGNTDALGDANTIASYDSRWDVDVYGTNDNNTGGAIHAYASDGGEIIYDGFDYDFIGTAEPSGNDWLSKLFYDELAQQWDPDGLPHSVPLGGGGGGPVPGCNRQAIRIGVVGVCADSITGQGTLTASGSVTLDGGLAIGGPLQIDTSSNSITSQGVVSIALLRSSGTVSLGSATLTIDATAATDPDSGKTNLAKVTLDSISFGDADSLPVGGLVINVPQGDGLTMYLDSAHGGGIIGSGTLELPKLGDTALSTAAALGFYAATPNPVQFLGGSVRIGTVHFGPGWAFDGLDLSYQSATDTWTASGGMTAPIGSLDASGSLVRGRLDSIQVNVGGQEWPLGDSGFFFTEFGGGVSGLVNGPLKLSASTGGFWGVPKSPVEPIYLNNVALTVDVSGAVTLDGKVSLILKDDSPVTGELHLAIRLSPFSATGTESVNGNLSPLAKLSVSAGAGFTTHAFTAAGTGSLSMHLLDGDGNEILSNKGVGASGTLCSHPVQVTKLGVTVTVVPKVCQTLGFAATWSSLGDLLHGRLGVLGHIVGGDPQSLVTVPVTSAASHGAPIRVPRHRNFLFIDVQSAGGPPPVTLLAPGAKHRSTTSTVTGPLLVSTGPSLGLTTITVVRPGAGVWRIFRSTPGPALHIHAETIHRVRGLHGSGGRAGSAKHGVGPKRRIRLRWSSAGLPGGVRVAIVDSRTPGRVAGAATLARDLRPNGTLTIRGQRLRAGRNWLIAVATLDRVPFSLWNFSGPTWRAPEPARKHRTR